MKTSVFETCKDFLFPYTCMGCGALVSQPERFCESCKKDLTYVGELPPIAQIRAAAAVYPYDRVSAGILRRKKEQGFVSEKAMAEDMELAFHRFRFPLPDLILPVPAHPFKTWWTQYDHGMLLAQAVAEQFNVPLGAGVLGKQRFTRPQHTLDRKKRSRNLVGAFAVHRPDQVRGKMILLVDDVITTGHTISACAAELRHSGAREVYALSYAYTQK